MARFPIYNADSKQQKIIIELVNKMLELNIKLKKAPKNSNEWNSIRTEIEKTDKKIDEEIYRLYGLTQKEIEILESSI